MILSYIVYLSKKPKDGDVLKFFSKSKPIIFEGETNEKYKATKNKWIRLAIIGTVMPLVISGIFSLYSGTFDFFEMFGNGEIILTLFSLTAPMLCDLFELKKENDDSFSWTFFWCLIINILQVIVYGLIKADQSQHKEIKGFIVSIIIAVASLLYCNHCIKSMFQYSNKKEG